MSMKSSNDTTGNRTRDLPACSSLLGCVYQTNGYVRNEQDHAFGCLIGRHIPTFRSSSVLDT